jgi:demethylmenaquinone methyltransferase/2-methoxy-6-polyprenyl-1,4-benzoquinol methylase
MMQTTAVDKSNQRVQRMFGEIAPNYDRMNHLLSMNVDRYWRWWTVRRLRPVAGQPILDLCTGTGDLALAFHRYTRGKAEIVGADFCPEMLEIGRQKQQKAGIGGELQFVEADAQHLPFADDRFQIVSVAFGLRNVADTDAGLREMVRVCRPGGQVAVLEFSSPAWQPFKAMYGWYFRNVLPRIGQALATNKSDAYKYLPESVGQFPCGAALAKRMEAAGLASVKYHALTGGIATLYVGVK